MLRRAYSATLTTAFVFAFVAATCPLFGQTRKTAKKPAPPKPAASAPVRVHPDVECPAVLGVGVTTKREFCDVMIGRDPQTGIIIRFPPHRGLLVLTFDLHNRETYSEQLVRERRAYTHHTATIGVLTLDGGLITRAVVDSEFRTAADLLDRVGGGAGPGGVKAVAPVGNEPIQVEIPEDVDAVSILGEKLLSRTVEGPETFVAPGRPIAIISNVMIEYRPAPPPKKKPAPKTTKKKKQE